MSPNAKHPNLHCDQEQFSSTVINSCIGNIRHESADREADEHSQVQHIIKPVDSNIENQRSIFQAAAPDEAPECEIEQQHHYEPRLMCVPHSIPVNMDSNASSSDVGGSMERINNTLVNESGHSLVIDEDT